MKSRIVGLCVIVLACLPWCARGQQVSGEPEVKYGYHVGESMPFHVVGFVAGARDHGGGCPSVMISNTRGRGVEVWSRTGSEEAFALAGALEAKLPDDDKPRGFLLVFDDTAVDALRAKTAKQGLKKFHVATPRSSTGQAFKSADGAGESAVLVFLMDQKQIKSALRFTAGELNDEAIQKIAKEAESFFAAR
jgi:hypothetical protein